MKQKRMGTLPRDFRFDVLGGLYKMNPRWVDLTPLVDECMKTEGKSHRYYCGILEQLGKKNLIALNPEDFQRFEQGYVGAFADFPLRAMILPDGIDEYMRIRREISLLRNEEERPVHISRKALIAWVGIVIAFITLVLAMAVAFHWFGL